MKKQISLFLLIIFILMQMPIRVYATASVSDVDEAGIKEILEGGEGIKISNVRSRGYKFLGFNKQIGKFSGASYVKGFKNIDDGIVLSTGYATAGLFTPASTFLSDYFNEEDKLIKDEGRSFDEVTLEFDAISDSNFISFQYIYASEEFDQDFMFNDRMEIQVNGKNIALLPDTGEEVSYVNLVNTQYHYDNQFGEQLAFLGYTTLLSCQANVEPGKVNHFKIIVQDWGDPIFDTAIFIKAHSITNKEAPKFEVNPEVNPEVDPEVDPTPPPMDYEKAVDFTKKVSAVKLTLADGSVLYDINLQGNSNANTITGILLSDEFLIATVDEELLHGATLEVEYDFTLQNSSQIPCLGYTIKDSLDNKFIYDANHSLLTEPVANSSYGWQILSDGENIQISNLSNLTNGQTVKKKLVLTSILSVSSLNDYVYKNSANATFKFARGGASKSANAIEIRLLPPFGKTPITNFYILGIIISFVILSIIILIKYILKKVKKV